MRVRKSDSSKHRRILLGNSQYLFAGFAVGRMRVSGRYALSLLVQYTLIGCLLSFSRLPCWTNRLTIKTAASDDFSMLFPRNSRVIMQQSTHEKSEVFIDSFSLSNWGVFQHVEMNLNSTASFAVITGETGAGKSVLIAGLEYMCGSFSFRGKKPLYRANIEGECLINLNTLNNKYKRVYNPNTKKTIAESNGQKVALKSLADMLSRRVMFWSMDNLDLLQNRNNDLLLYIDKMLGTEGSLHHLMLISLTYVLNSLHVYRIRGARAGKTVLRRMEIHIR